MKEKLLLVAGTFDANGGKPSGFADKMASSLAEFFDVNPCNGGYYDKLNSLLNSDESIIIWMPNIPNDYPKLLNKVKEVNPKRLLVSSKRNDDGKYSFKALVARSLKSKSNLFIEFTVNNGKVVSSLFDPLGNCFVKNETDIPSFVNALAKRIYDIHAVTRFSSAKIGEAIKAVETEDIKLFLSYAKEHANTFHKIIHSGDDKNDRFVGNLSFRCEHGFPSFKKDGLIFVSKRNVDKRDISVDSFVAVEVDLYSNRVKYYGDNKPSVDTPIQVSLYEHLPKIKWMLHSHVYIKDAPFTESIIPCGSFEEVDEILRCVSDKDKDEYFVNLVGHGSIVMSSKVNTFDGELNDRYVSRNIPEMVK